jgi:diaminopimelate epimerase
MDFIKYQALGNDYLVLNPQEWGQELSPECIRRICDRHYGAGSDGILLGPLPAEKADFGVRIFNPDGSEAEKSGNGLRIFTRALWDWELLQKDLQRPGISLPCSIQTKGGLVRAQVLENGRSVRVSMGQATFDSTRIPVTGPGREVINETMILSGEPVRYCAVSLGNPHCVVICDQTSEALARRLGPLIENEARFPNRTNVQFMQVLDRNNIRIYIWERGAGYTLASGSSSCAAASVAHKLGTCDEIITVHNPGGQILVDLAGDGMINMTGPVERVYRGIWDQEKC